MSLEQFQHRWDELDQLFHQARKLPPEAVEAFCVQAGGDDPAFGRFLFELVTAADNDDDCIRQCITEVAHDVAFDTDLEGERAGVWQIGERIDHAGMGEVYLATRADGQFGKRVTMKVLRQPLSEARFRRRYAAAQDLYSSLPHPCIPALVDAGQLPDNRPFLVTEYVEGTAIDTFCTASALPVRQRIELVERVCSIVQHAHAANLLGLDIKPTTISICRDGTPRLLNMGLSRLFGEAAADENTPSPAYASPEQLRGHEPTVASDVYSMGALLYRLIENEHPFTADPSAPVRAQLAAREAVANKLKRSIIPTRADRELRAIILKAMAVTPSQRYAAIDNLSQDLENYRRSVPVSALPHTVAYRAQKFIRRQRVPLLLSLILLAVVAGMAMR